jgi:hypothetical protein
VQTITIRLSPSYCALNDWQMMFVLDGWRSPILISQADWMSRYSPGWSSITRNVRT